MNDAESVVVQLVSKIDGVKAVWLIVNEFLEEKMIVLPPIII